MGIISDYQKTGLMPNQVEAYLANYFIYVKLDNSGFSFFY
jgi:hypothetical protein